MSQKRNPDIGKRAAEQIRQRAEELEIDVDILLHELEIVNLEAMQMWESRDRSPCTHTLCMMAEENYDIVYILTGRRTKGGEKA